MIVFSPRQNGRSWRSLGKRVGVGLLAAATLVGFTRGTQDAVANGDTRTIEIIQMHTKERVSVTFRRNGRYVDEGLKELNWVMRDWRRNEPTRMDPRLFDLLWEVHRSTGSRQPVHVVSAYRAPATNESLRRRSSAVAQNSQHTHGKAVDFYLPDVGADRIRTIGMRLQRGGVGYYPRSNTPFIHLDTGSVRHWPRMPRQQLVRLFPDQQTVHIPADGKPLAGFEAARREVLARGGTVFGESGEAVATESTGRRSIWATLFGGGGGEDSDADMAEAEAIGESGWILPGTQFGVTPAPSRAPAPAPAPAPVPAPAPAPVVAEAPPPPAQPVTIAAPIAPPVAPPRFEARQAEPPAPAPAPAQIASAQATVSVPLPVARPRSLGAAEPSRTAQTAQAAPAEPPGPRLVWNAGPDAMVPASDAIGVEVASASASATTTPVPPRRPGPSGGVGALVTAFAATPPAGDALAQLGLRSSTGEAAPGAALAFVSPPRPPARPSLAASPVREPDRTASLPRTAPARGQIAAARDERAALRALFAAQAQVAPRNAAAPRIQVAAARTSAAPAATRVFVADRGARLDLGFSGDPTGDLTTGSFTGPAVKPLPVRR